MVLALRVRRRGRACGVCSRRGNSFHGQQISHKRGIETYYGTSHVGHLYFEGFVLQRPQTVGVFVAILRVEVEDRESNSEFTFFPARRDASHKFIT